MLVWLHEFLLQLLPSLLVLYQLKILHVLNLVTLLHLLQLLLIGINEDFVVGIRGQPGWRLKLPRTLVLDLLQIFNFLSHYLAWRRAKPGLLHEAIHIDIFLVLWSLRRNRVFQELKWIGPLGVVRSRLLHGLIWIILKLLLYLLLLVPKQQLLLFLGPSPLVALFLIILHLLLLYLRVKVDIVSPHSLV